jgi:hypothetical protein
MRAARRPVAVPRVRARRAAPDRARPSRPQLALLALVALYLPRSTSPTSVKLDAADFKAPAGAAAAAASLDGQPAAGAGDAPLDGHHRPPSPDDVYAVVIDAGSTGERGSRRGGGGGV